RLRVLVAAERVDFLHLHRRQRPAIVAQEDLAAPETLRVGLADVEHDRDGPWDAARQPARLQDRVVIRFPEEALERRVDAEREVLHLARLALAEIEGRKALDAAQGLG